MATIDKCSAPPSAKAARRVRRSHRPTVKKSSTSTVPKAMRVNIHQGRGTQTQPANGAPDKHRRLTLLAAAKN